MFEDRMLIYSKQEYIVNTLTIRPEEVPSITEIQSINATDITIFNLDKSDIVISGTFKLLNLDNLHNTVTINNIEKYLHRDNIDITLSATIDNG